MPEYWFFLSYARRDAVGEPYVRRFHKRLSRAIGRVAGLPTDVAEDDIGFLDTTVIKPGESWPYQLGDAIRLSKVFVCLYSPAYFNSEFCGKELQAYLLRLSESVSSDLNGSNPPLIIPILWDRADRLPDRMPSTLEHLQYVHGANDEMYRSEGLYQLLSLKKHEDRCREFFDHMAATIIDRVREYPLSPGKGLPPLRDIASAFGTSINNDPPSQVVLGQSSGPRTAEFVFVAAKDTEMQELRQSTEAYGSEGGRDWRPYLDKAVGFLGQTLSAQEELFYEQLPVDSKLIDRLRDAEKRKTIVVIIVDPWTVQLMAYEKRMSELDQSSFVNTEILIPWNAKDQETLGTIDQLRGSIKWPFRRHFMVNSPYIRDSINSLDELERELTGAISRARARIIQISEFVRPIDKSIALPRYSRPAGGAE